MTEGRHYWEVEIHEGTSGIMVGAARPGVDHDEFQHSGSNTYFIAGFSGGLFGNFKINADPQGALLQGDRVGVMLDLDAGWMRFFRNGKRFGPGYTSGVTGPLVRAAQLLGKGDTVTVLPGATAPEGAGANARKEQFCNAQNEQGAVLAPKDARTCVPHPCSALCTVACERALASSTHALLPSCTPLLYPAASGATRRTTRGRCCPVRRRRRARGRPSRKAAAAAAAAAASLVTRRSSAALLSLLLP
jgi:hypothetical protein